MSVMVLLAALQQLPAQNFPPIDKPGVVANLGALLDHPCPHPAPGGRQALLDEESRLAQPAIAGHLTADGWVAVGCARARLDADSAIAHDGPLMVAGNSWSQGSQRAMIEALRQRPNDARAAEVLSLEALDGDEPDNMRDALAAILTITAHGTPTPATLRACAELALRVGAEAAARDCAVRGLAGGSDSTWHLLRLARLSFRAADTVTGLRQFQAAANAAHDSAARREVDWHLQWFLSPDERKEWDTVSTAAYGRWVRDRLLSRDVRDGQPFGARLAEHFGRLEFVEQNFRLHVAKVMKHSFRTIPAVRENGTTPGEGTSDELNFAAEPGSVSAAMWREYRRWQTDYDDRGVVWMRFGKPDQRIPWSCPLHKPPTPKLPPTDTARGHVAQDCKETEVIREVWKYLIDGQAMLVSFEGEGFDGSVQATRLVTGVVGSYMCDVDPKRCALTEQARLGHLLPEDVEHLRAEDREYVAVATTTDDNSVRSDRAIGLVARLHRLWDPLTGAPIALVTWALPVKDLSAQEQHDHARSAVVDFALREWDPRADRWRDTVFTRRWILPDTGGKRPDVTGFVVVASTPGVSSWSLVATQPEQRSGRAWDVTTPGLDTGPLALSDLVLGAESQGLTWEFHNEPIPLAPVNAVDRNGLASLYFQLRSESARDGLRAAVALYRVTGDAGDSTAVLEVGFGQAVHAGITELAPQLDLSRLGSGSYRLEVRVSNAAGRVLARRSAPLQLQ